MNSRRTYFPRTNTRQIDVSTFKSETQNQPCFKILRFNNTEKNISNQSCEALEKLNSDLRKPTEKYQKSNSIVFSKGLNEDSNKNASIEFCVGYSFLSYDSGTYIATLNMNKISKDTVISKTKRKGIYKASSIFIDSINFFDFDTIVENLGGIDSLVKNLIKNEVELSVIHKKYLSKELCDKYSEKSNLMSIRYTPEEFMSNTMILNQIEKFPSSIQFIPDDHRSQAFYFQAIDINPECFKYIPDKYKTKDLSLYAIDRDVSLIPYCFKEVLDEDFYKHIVKNSSFSNLSFIPENLRTYEVCLLCVKNKIDNLKIVPREFLTEEMCDLVFMDTATNVKNWKDIVSLVPEIFLNRERCLKIIKNNVNNISLIPLKMRTKELCIVVVSRNSHLINSVPKEFLDEDFYMEALNVSHSHNIRGLVSIIPESMKTEAMCKRFIEINPELFKFVPDSLKTREMCIITAQKMVGNPFETIPEKFLDIDFYTEVYKKNKKSLKFVPTDVITEEFGKMVVEDDPDNIKYVPYSIQNSRMCSKAVKHNPNNITWINKELLTEDICVDSILNIENFKYIPNNLVNQKLCDIIIESDPNMISSIPDRFKTKEICKKALKNAYNIRFVPDEFKTLKSCIESLKTGDTIEFIPKNMRKDVFEILSNV